MSFIVLTENGIVCVIFIFESKLEEIHILESDFPETLYYSLNLKPEKMPYYIAKIRSLSILHRQNPFNYVLSNLVTQKKHPFSVMIGRQRDVNEAKKCKQKLAITCGYDGLPRAAEEKEAEEEKQFSSKCQETRKERPFWKRKETVGGGI